MTVTPFLSHRATLRSVVPMTRDNYLFEFTLDGDTTMRCQPGQFLEVWVPGVGECPISVCSGSTDNKIQLCIRRAGRVTSAIFDLNEGDWIGLRGPYGRGFPVEQMLGKDICMIAGGLGVAPIRSLWQFILNRREDYGKLVLIYGMRHSEDLLFRQEFKLLLRRRDIDVYIGAEEIRGPELPPISAQLGRVTDMVRMSDLNENFHAAVCGPPVMYKYVIDELKAKQIAEDNIWLSLERHMKCGLGRCGHCYVGGKFACKSGPVFSLSELRFVPEAVECRNGECK